MSESETQSGATDVSTEEEHEKDVIVTAYSDGEYTHDQEFINEVFADIVDFDPGATYEEENRNIEIEISFEGEDDSGYESEISEKISPYSSWKKEIVANYFNDKELPEYLTLTDETEIVERHEYSPSKTIRTYVNECIPDNVLSDIGFEDSDYDHYVGSWSREIEDNSVDAEEGDTITQYCRATVNNKIDKRRPLVHQSERTKENRYETDDEMWSFQTKVHIECSTDEEVDKISKAIVPKLYDHLWGIDDISSVRLESCEQSVKKKGECYNF